MPTRQYSRAAALLIITAIGFYRKYLSSFLLHSCRMYPTCSEYARESVEHHGAVYGSIYAVRRLLRCHPLSQTLVDPVK